MSNGSQYGQFPQQGSGFSQGPGYTQGSGYSQGPTLHQGAYSAPTNNGYYQEGPAGNYGPPLYGDANAPQPGAKPKRRGSLLLKIGAIALPLGLIALVVAGFLIKGVIDDDRGVRFTNSTTVEASSENPMLVIGYGAEDADKSCSFTGQGDVTIKKPMSATVSWGSTSYALVGVLNVAESGQYTFTCAGASEFGMYATSTVKLNIIMGLIWAGIPLIILGILSLIFGVIGRLTDRRR